MAAVSPLGRATAVEPHGAAPAAAAAEGLYERHSDSIYRYCLSQLRSHTEAEDAAQTTFLYAFRALGRGVVPRVEIAWLLTIAKNVCRTQRENAGRRSRREIASDPLTLEVAVSPQQRLLGELAGLEEALLELPAGQRRALLLREWQGLSYREIAATMELSQSAVETLLFRARRGLAQALEGRGKSRLQRVRQALDFGWLGTLKGMVGGASAAKLAAGAAVMATLGAVAGDGDLAARHDAPAVAKPGLTRPSSIFGTRDVASRARAATSKRPIPAVGDRDAGAQLPASARGRTAPPQSAEPPAADVAHPQAGSPESAETPPTPTPSPVSGSTDTPVQVPDSPLQTPTVDPPSLVTDTVDTVQETVQNTVDNVEATASALPVTLP